MSSHDELSQLSAYLDGELDAAGRSRIDAHLQTCAECRATLDALRATLTDLATLPEPPSPTEQDSWALRSALARARRPAKRWRRASWAAGTVAAGVIAFVAITHGASNTHRTGGVDAVAKGSGRAGEAASAEIPVTTVAGNFTAQSAQARLLDVAGKVPGAMPAAGAPTPGSSGNFYAVTPLSKGAYDSSALPKSRVPTSALDRCVGVVTRSATQALTPFRYELVTFESKPAFFLFFSTTERVELWVVTRARCDVLFFAQTG